MVKFKVKPSQKENPRSFFARLLKVNELAKNLGKTQPSVLRAEIGDMIGKI